MSRQSKWPQSAQKVWITCVSFCVVCATLLVKFIDKLHQPYRSRLCCQCRGWYTWYRDIVMMFIEASLLIKKFLYLYMSNKEISLLKYIVVKFIDFKSYVLDGCISKNIAHSAQCALIFDMQPSVGNSFRMSLFFLAVTNTLCVMRIVWLSIPLSFSQSLYAACCPTRVCLSILVTFGRHRWIWIHPSAPTWNHIYHLAT